MMHAARARQDRDHPSWNDLLAKVEQQLRRWYAGERIPPPFQLDDLVEATLDTVFRDLVKIELRDRVNFWSWVRVVARNRLIDLARQARRQDERGARVDVHGGTDSSGAPQLADARATPASLFARTRELHLALQDCLRALRPETADVLRLRLLEHRSSEEIAAVIGRQRIATVRSIFSRGRERLARCLSAKGFADCRPDAPGMTLHD